MVILGLDAFIVSWLSLSFRITDTTLLVDLNTIAILAYILCFCKPFALRFLELDVDVQLKRKNVQPTLVYLLFQFLIWYKNTP